MALALPFPRYDPDVHGITFEQNAESVPVPVQLNAPPVALRELAVTELLTEACARAGAASRKSNGNTNVIPNFRRLKVCILVSVTCGNAYVCAVEVDKLLS